MHRATLVLAAALGTLLLAGCGGVAGDGGGEPASPPASPPAAAAVPGPDGGLTVEQARVSDADGPLLVRGFYVSNGANARLCSALAESDPPQCGGASLQLDPNLMLDAELQTKAGVSWSPREVSLLGDVAGDVLRVSETSR